MLLTERYHTERYRRWTEKDATRPILLNLGQGVASDRYIGRKERRNRPEAPVLNHPGR